MERSKLPCRFSHALQGHQSACRDADPARLACVGKPQDVETRQDRVPPLYPTGCAVASWPKGALGDSGRVPRRAPMTATEMSSLLVRFLSGLSGGSVEVDIDSAPFASVDAQSRNLDLQIAPLLSGQRRGRSIMQLGGPVGLWKARRIPTELARRGWRLTLYDGTHELLALGRGTSALTGRIHVNPAALWKLRKLV